MNPDQMLVLPKHTDLFTPSLADLELEVIKVLARLCQISLAAHNYKVWVASAECKRISNAIQRQIDDNSRSYKESLAYAIEHSKRI